MKDYDESWLKFHLINYAFLRHFGKSDVVDEESRDRAVKVVAEDVNRLFKEMGFDLEVDEKYVFPQIQLRYLHHRQKVIKRIGGLADDIAEINRMREEQRNG